MIQIILADREQHTQPIREFFWDYLQWANTKCSVVMYLDNSLRSYNIHPYDILLLYPMILGKGVRNKSA